MRVILFLLVALALGKVGTQSYIRQQSAKDTIINAYREHALAACRQTKVSEVLPGGQGGAASGELVRSGTFQQTPGGEDGVSVELVIGKADVNVRLWQTSHVHWATRYKDPFLIVRTASSEGPVVCEYDITRGTALAHTAASAPSANRS